MRLSIHVEIVISIVIATFKLSNQLCKMLKLKTQDIWGNDYIDILINLMFIHLLFTSI